MRAPSNNRVEIDLGASRGTLGVTMGFFAFAVTNQVKGRLMKNLTALMLCCFVTGCATIGSLQPGAGGSTFEVTGKSYDEIWKASVKGMSSNLTIVESDKASGSIKSEARVGMATWGEVVGLFIRPAAANAERYTVEVQSLKRSRLQITGQDHEPAVIAIIKAELGM